MVSDTRTVLKNFNRDRLTEQLTSSALPFIQVHLAGFEKINQFVRAPATEPRLILRRRLRDGSYFEDFAQPGEVRFEFTIALTSAEAAALDALLSAHDATQRTADQQRIEQDDTDWNTLVANFPNWDSFNDTQRNNFLKVLARVVIREKRNATF